MEEQNQQQPTPQPEKIKKKFNYLAFIALIIFFINILQLVIFKVYFLSGTIFIILYLLSYFFGVFSFYKRKIKNRGIVMSSISLFLNLALLWLVLIAFSFIDMYSSDSVDSFYVNFFGALFFLLYVIPTFVLVIKFLFFPLRFRGVNETPKHKRAPLLISIAIALIYIQFLWSIIGFFVAIYNSNMIIAFSHGCVFLVLINVIYGISKKRINYLFLLFLLPLILTPYLLLFEVEDVQLTIAQFAIIPTICMILFLIKRNYFNPNKIL